jgi:hypothetical protein
MASARNDLIPAEVQPLLAGAVEVLVRASVNLPLDLARALRDQRLPGERVAFQCARGARLESILALLEADHPVFEIGGDAQDTQLLIDRRHGFLLPTWTPVPDPFGAACRLAWSRTAAFVAVNGTVAALDDELACDFVIMRLTENPYLRLSVSRSIATPVIGQAVTCLGRHDFHYGPDMPLLDCVGLFPLRAVAANSASVVDRNDGR